MITYSIIHLTCAALAIWLWIHQNENLSLASFALAISIGPIFLLAGIMVVGDGVIIYRRKR